jgi:hypothetical protein
MRFRAPLAGLIALGGAVALTASPASAEGSPWTPYEQQDFVVSAERSTCDFDVAVEVVEDGELYSTLSTYDDGSPRTQLWRGPLVMSYTNLDNGTSVVRDLSATATIDYRADGSLASITSVEGAFGATMPAGSTPETGMFVFSGHGTTVTFNEDGTRSYTLGETGTAENVCEAIG